ncbi:MAG: hypothetical protein LBV45_03905 [Xanthomonadaceae bacterium]|jgi:Na+/melibiose symporter-like transporter|nr:hypothetical protein [Xanthomonadaceae bacterium]
MDYHILITVAKMLPFTLPEIIASSIVLVLLLLKLPRGTVGRSAALAGVSALLITSILSALTAMLPPLYLLGRAHHGLDVQTVRIFYLSGSIVNFILKLGFAIGLVVMVWGLCSAIRLQGPSR